MRKAIIAMFATAGLAFGSLAVAAPAQAAEYPGTVKTATSLSASSKVVGGKKFTASVRVTGGSASAVAGVVTFTFNGKSVSRSVSNGIGSVSFTTPKRTSDGRYTLRASYAPKAGSVYKASSNSRTVTVTTTPNYIKTTTSVSVKKKIKRGSKASVKATVKASSGKSAGKVKVTIKGPGYNKSKTVTVKSGKRVSATLGPLKKKGTYKVTVTFTPAKGSPFKSSKKTTRIKVS